MVDSSYWVPLESFTVSEGLEGNDKEVALTAAHFILHASFAIGHS
jgi:hypothetical protein